MGDGGWLRRPRQPWLRQLGAHGEPGSGREREGRSFGKVEEGVEVFTAGGIEPGWLDGGDLRGLCPLFENRGKQN